MEKWWKELIDDKSIAIVALALMAIVSLAVLGVDGKEVALACAGGIGGAAVGKVKG